MSKHFSSAANTILRYAILRMEEERDYEAFDTTMLFIGMLEAQKSSVFRKILNQFSLVIHTPVNVVNRKNADGVYVSYHMAPKFITENFGIHFEETGYRFTRITRLTIDVLEKAYEKSRHANMNEIQTHHILEACLLYEKSIPCIALCAVASNKNINRIELINACASRAHERDPLSVF